MASLCEYQCCENKTITYLHHQKIVSVYNKVATDPRAPIYCVEVITSNIYSRYNDLINRIGKSVSQMTTEMFYLS